VTLRQGKEEARTSWGEGATDVASRWENEGADGLHIIDLDAAFGKGSNRETILGILKGSGIPVEVGGGVRTPQIAKEWLESGASRVVVGTLAYAEPSSLADLLRRHGPERIVVAADYADGKVVTRGWTVPQEIGVFEAAKRMESAGVSNLLVTAVGHDGMAGGPDLATIGRLCESTRVRIIASGGIRDPDDLKELERMGAAAAVLGRALYDGSIRMEGLRK
jgi:phosphoribosylformimino-5-aminoimidazole carboxamide ribotide isomerase